MTAAYVSETATNSDASLISLRDPANYSRRTIGIVAKNSRPAESINDEYGFVKLVNLSEVRIEVLSENGILHLGPRALLPEEFIYIVRAGSVSVVHRRAALSGRPVADYGRRIFIPGAPF